MSDEQRERFNESRKTARRKYNQRKKPCFRNGGNSHRKLKQYECYEIAALVSAIEINEALNTNGDYYGINERTKLKELEARALGYLAECEGWKHRIQRSNGGDFVLKRDHENR